MEIKRLSKLKEEQKIIYQFLKFLIEEDISFYIKVKEEENSDYRVFRQLPDHCDIGVKVIKGDEFPFITDRDVTYETIVLTNHEKPYVFNFFEEDKILKIKDIFKKEVSVADILEGRDKISNIESVTVNSELEHVYPSGDWVDKLVITKVPSGDYVN